jgi:hypothetical protein
VLRGYERRGRSATSSSDGARIVIAFADRAARISDAAMEITRIRSGRGGITCGAFLGVTATRISR